MQRYKAQRYKAQRSFQPVKARRKMRNLFFLISEAQRNFHNELLIQLKGNAIAERHFRTKLNRNVTYAIEISKHQAYTAFFAILDRKKILLKKAVIYQITIEMEQNWVHCTELRY